MAGEHFGYGAGAFGVETLASDIPNVGSANYSGASAGTYIDENGERYLTRSKFKVSANFRSGKVDMGTIDIDVDLSGRDPLPVA